MRGALTAIPAIGGTSHQVDAVVHPHAELLGFTSQRKTLFSGYPVALRPDWYLPLGLGGMPLARIGELVGHGDLVTTARTYTHVVADEAELDYDDAPRLLAAG